MQKSYPAMDMEMASEAKWLVRLIWGPDLSLVALSRPHTLRCWPAVPASMGCEALQASDRRSTASLAGRFCFTPATVSSSDSSYGRQCLATQRRCRGK